MLDELEHAPALLPHAAVIEFQNGLAWPPHSWPLFWQPIMKVGSCEATYSTNSRDQEHFWGGPYFLRCPRSLQCLLSKGCPTVLKKRRREGRKRLTQQTPALRSEQLLCGLLLEFRSALLRPVASAQEPPQRVCLDAGIVFRVAASCHCRCGVVDGPAHANKHQKKTRHRTGRGLPE